MKRVLLFISLFIFSIFLQKISAQKICTRTSYRDSMDWEREKDTFSRSGLLLRKDIRRYELTISASLTPPPAKEIKYSIAYKYDKKRRCIFEKSNYYMGTMRKNEFRDSSGIILQSYYSSFDKKWRSEDLYRTNNHGDTCMSLHYGGPDPEKPNSGWKDSLVYANGVLTEKWHYKFGVPDRWQLDYIHRYFCSVSTDPDSVYFFNAGNQFTGKMLYKNKYDKRGRILYREVASAEYRDQAEWQYNSIGKCTRYVISHFKNDSLLQKQKFFWIYNSNGHLIRQYSPEQPWFDKKYSYTYY